MAAVELHLRLRVRAGERQRFLVFLREAIPVYESPGGITIGLLEDLNDDHRFIEVVSYADEDTFRRDQKRVEHDPVVKGFLERWRALHAEPVQVEVYRRVQP